TAYQSIPTIGLTPFPPNFGGDGLTYHGGNLLCLINPGTPFLQAQFAFDDACSIPTRFTILGTNKNMLFALFASGATNLDAICSLQDSANCISTLTQVQSQLSIIGATGPSFSSLRQQATLDMPIINVTQYAQDILSNWLILQQPLLTPDPHWSFYGWLTLFDWAEGQREVVSVEGDLSTVVVMSERFPIFQLTMIDGNLNSQSGPRVIYSLVLYTTIAIGFVALIVFGYTLRDGYAINGRHCFSFNRVAALVWVGRPLFLLRGLTAVLMLSTSQPHLGLQPNGYAQFTNVPRTFLETCVVAGEATWVVYVINDAFVVFAVDLARFAAPMASALAWLVTVGLDVVQPIKLHVSLDRVCTTGDADEYLFCHSGVVVVGSWTRVCVLGVVDIVAVLLAFGVVLVKQHGRRFHNPTTSAQSTPLLLHLHGSAQAFLSLPRRDAAMELDSVASAMSGLIQFAVRRRTYTFDINLWTVAENEIHRHGKSILVRSVSVKAKMASHPSLAHQRLSWGMAAIAIGSSLAYVVLTATGSVSYIVVSKVNFANDFYWATFNMTAHHIAIADWFNQQLWLDRNMTNIRLDDPKWSTLGVNYTSSTLQVVSSPWYGPRLQFEKLNTVRASIQGLRQSDGCLAPWIYSQYCWLDVQRRWAMANSPIRQTRLFFGISIGTNFGIAGAKLSIWLLARTWSCPNLVEIG
ncbi:hypothetical protein As57867_006068, partial [Aphanomyces stellatus]